MNAGKAEALVTAVARAVLNRHRLASHYLVDRFTKRAAIKQFGGIADASATPLGGLVSYCISDCTRSTISCSSNLSL